MHRLLLAILFLAPVIKAADACNMIPGMQIASMLGDVKSTGIDKMKLPPKAVSGKACTYKGQDNSATYVLTKFPAAADARAYLKTVRDGLEKQNLKTTSERFDGEEGFSFATGMIAVKKNVWLRVNVNSTKSKVLVPDLTRQLMQAALRAN